MFGCGKKETALDGYESLKYVYCGTSRIHDSHMLRRPESRNKFFIGVPDRKTILFLYSRINFNKDIRPWLVMPGFVRNL